MSVSRNAEAIYVEARQIAAGRARHARPRKEHLAILIYLIDELAQMIPSAHCPNPNCRDGIIVGTSVGCAVCQSGDTP